MKKLVFNIFLFICLLPLVTEGSIKKGTIAPDFNFIDIENRTFSLYNFKEKVILIEFFSTKCFACDYVIPDINRLYDKFKKDRVRVIGILFSDEIENTNKLKEFMQSRQITYPIYVADVKYKKTFGLYGFPNFLILNEKKEVVQMFRGITKDTFGLLNREIENLLTGNR